MGRGGCRGVLIRMMGGEALRTRRSSRSEEGVLLGSEVVCTRYLRNDWTVFLYGMRGGAGARCSALSMSRGLPLAFHLHGGNGMRGERAVVERKRAGESARTAVRRQAPNLSNSALQLSLRTSV